MRLEGEMGDGPTPVPTYPNAFRSDESFALATDSVDSLRIYQGQFQIPQRSDGRPAIYFCGHSLGLQPKSVRDVVHEELDAWAARGIDGYFEGPTAWYHYQQLLRPMMARIVGAQPSEVILMNGLTINLHLMLATFFQPRSGRRKILMEAPAFPSDLYAIKSHLRQRGLNPEDALVTLHPRAGEHCIRFEDIEQVLDAQAPEIALVLLSGVNFFTGQFFDLRRIVAAGHRQKCIVGFDLAHAAGNVPLALHDWDADFAVWCNYKYLSGGPGAVAGAFVHEKHGRNVDLPRWAGWWGNDPSTRFRMHLEAEFAPYPGTDGWQVSCPPILGLAPLRASLAIYDAIGMPALRAKSEALTGYLQFLLAQLPPGRFEVITPLDPAQRGCQLSLLVYDNAQALFHALEREGIIGDFRPPNIIRMAPIPLYNTFHEVWQFANTLRRHIA
jgi:kynureninase